MSTPPSFSVRKIGKWFLWREDDGVGNGHAAIEFAPPPAKRPKKQRLRKATLRNLRIAWPTTLHASWEADDNLTDLSVIDLKLCPRAQSVAVSDHYPHQRLPRLLRGSDLFSGLEHLTLSDARDEHDENLVDSAAVQSRPSDQPLRGKAHARSCYTAKALDLSRTHPALRPTAAAKHSWARAVDDWVYAPHEHAVCDNSDIVPASLNVPKKSIPSWNHRPDASASVSPLLIDLQHSVDIEIQRQLCSAKRPSQGLDEVGPQRIKRSRLFEPHPEPPSPMSTASDSWDQADSGIGSEMAQEHDANLKAALQQLHIHDAPKISPSASTTMHTQVKPAVTHETVIEKRREVRQEMIIQEIHNHHVLHRELPIIDFEVLPARHFVPVKGGGSREISAAELQPETGDRVQWAIAEALSKTHPLPRTATRAELSSQASALQLRANAGDRKEWTTPDGVHHTEQWHLHPPTLDDRAQLANQTEAFHFGSPDPKDDGLRIVRPRATIDQNSRRQRQAE